MSGISKIQKRTRMPTCTLCANHGIRSPLKGHKYECEFSDCECKLCDQGRERREVMRKQVKLRRHQMKRYDALTSGSKEGVIKCDASSQRTAPVMYSQRPHPQGAHHNISPGCPYPTLPPRVNFPQRNNRPLPYYINMSPVLPGILTSPKNNSPVHHIRPVIAGRLSVSDNSAFDRILPHSNSNHWSCEVNDSKEAAYTLAALQQKISFNIH